MKIKMIDFFAMEINSLRLSIIYTTILSGCCYGILIFIINNAANIVFQDISVELYMIGIYAVICIVFYVSHNYALFNSIQLATDVIALVRLRILDKLRHAELLFIEKKGHADIHMRLTQDFNTIFHAVPVLFASVEDLITVIVIYMYIAIISFESFVVIISFLSISILYFYSKYFLIKKDMMQSGKTESEFFGMINDVIKGFKQIKLHFQKNEDLFKDIVSVSKESEKYKIQGLITYREHTMKIMIFHFTMYATLLFVMPIYFDLLRVSILKIFAALLFAQGPLDMVFRSFATIAMTNVAVKNLQDLEEELDQNSHAIIEQESHVKDFEKISLKSVLFQYKDSQGEISFQSGPIDLTIRKQDVIFIVGGNGSGKSTLLKLLTGLYPTLPPGQIFLDNQPITSDTMSAYRQLFSIIFTDYYLFKKLYGLESVDEKVVKQMLKTMLLHRKTQFFNNQFSNTDLSTGQRKRLACIEALLEDKPIYVFDEWTADQDPVFRKFLYETILQDLKKAGKTVIIVTHDDRYFHYADTVITMENGKIQE
ncbi:MAG: ATP-binding cassette transporter [Candidatus Magnetoglobus multicellularis str. Araruama]|uniref:ATP-binding cassette transporter n=1 Tax=Candidatus Magnetoglobus multicellularis str. Araruama TaxID=890399 RepID=A0A1V1P5N1_9BACT|nr:MAG: ATP-binding cassette transporter [Candidatus Magnetoglobus multicellularis str. Araruama]